MIGSGPLWTIVVMTSFLPGAEQALDGLAHPGDAEDDDPADPEQYGQPNGNDLTETQASPCGPLEAG